MEYKYNLKDFIRPGVLELELVNTVQEVSTEKNRHLAACYFKNDSKAHQIVCKQIGHYLECETFQNERKVEESIVNPNKIDSKDFLI